MSETHTEVRKGWTITVWLNGSGAWNYIATKNSLYRSGWVHAFYRTDAVENVLFELGELT